MCPIARKSALPNICMSSSKTSRCSMRCPYRMGTGNVVVAGDRVYVGAGRSVYEIDALALARRVAARPGLDLRMRVE